MSNRTLVSCLIDGIDQDRILQCASLLSRRVNRRNLERIKRDESNRKSCLLGIAALDAHSQQQAGEDVHDALRRPQSDNLDVKEPRYHDHPYHHNVADLSWFSLVNNLNDQLLYRLPVSLLYEFSPCHFAFGTSLTWTDRDTAGRDSSSRRSETAASAKRVRAAGSRQWAGGKSKSLAVKDRLEESVTAFTSCRLGLHRRNHRSLQIGENNDQWISEMDCVAVGTVRGRIRLYSRALMRYGQSKQTSVDLPSSSSSLSSSFSSPRVSHDSPSSESVLNGWRHVLDIQPIDQLISSSSSSSTPLLGFSPALSGMVSHPSEIVNHLPTSISLHPAIPSLASTGDGLLLGGTSQGSVLLWILINLFELSGSSRAVLSTVVSPPSIGSPVTALTLTLPSDAFSQTTACISTAPSQLPTPESLVPDPLSPPESVAVLHQQYRSTLSDDASTTTVTTESQSSSPSSPVPTAVAAWATGDVLLLRFILNNQFKSVCQRRRLLPTDTSIGHINRCHSYCIPPQRGLSTSQQFLTSTPRLIIVLACTHAFICFQLLPKLEMLFRTIQRRHFSCSNPVTPLGIENHHCPNTAVTDVSLPESSSCNQLIGSFVGIVRSSETDWFLRFVIVENSALTIRSVSLVNNEWRLPPCVKRTAEWSTHILDMISVGTSLVAILEENRISLVFLPLEEDKSAYVLSQINISSLPCSSPPASATTQRFLGYLECASKRMVENSNESIVLLLTHRSNGNPLDHAQRVGSCIEAYRLTPVYPNVYVAKWLELFDSHIADLDGPSSAYNPEGQGGSQSSVDLVDVMLALLFHNTVVANAKGITQQFDLILCNSSGPSDQHLGPSIQGGAKLSASSLHLLCIELCQQLLTKLLNLSEKLTNRKISLEKFSKLFHAINHNYLRETPWGANPDSARRLAFSRLDNSRIAFVDLLYSCFMSLLLSTGVCCVVEFLYLLSPYDWLTTAPESLSALTAHLTSLALARVPPPSESSTIEDPSSLKTTSNQQPVLKPQQLKHSEVLLDLACPLGLNEVSSSPSSPGQLDEREQSSSAMPLTSSSSSVAELIQVLVWFKADSARNVWCVLEEASKNFNSVTPNCKRPDLGNDDFYRRSTWFEFIIPFLLAAQQNKEHAINEAVNAALYTYTRIEGGAESHSWLNDRKILMFAILEKLVDVIGLREDKPSDLEMITVTLKHLSHLSNIDLQRASELFCKVCLKPLTKIIEKKFQQRYFMQKTSFIYHQSVNKVNAAQESADIHHFDIPVKDFNSNNNQHLIFSTECSETRSALIDDPFFIDQILFMGDRLRQQLVQRNWNVEECLLLEELTRLLLVISQHGQTHECHPDRLSFLVKRFVELSSLMKTDEQLCTFIQDLTNNDADGRLTAIALETLMTSTIGKQCSKMALPVTNRFPRSILQLYASVGRFQEGQGVIKNSILLSLENLKNGETIEKHYSGCLLSIQRLFDSQFALMSESLINQFWIDFVLELFAATLKNGQIAAAQVWRLLVYEIFAYGWIQSCDDKFKPTITLSPHKMTELIFYLLSSLSQHQSPLPSPPNVNNLQTINENQTFSRALKLPSNILSHVTSSQELLCHLASHSDSSERILSAAVECYEKSIMQTLGEVLSLERSGVAQHGLSHQQSDILRPSSFHRSTLHVPNVDPSLHSSGHRAQTAAAIPGLATINALQSTMKDFRITGTSFYRTPIRLLPAPELETRYYTDDCNREHSDQEPRQTLESFVELISNGLQVEQR